QGGHQKNESEDQGGAKAGDINPEPLHRSKESEPQVEQQSLVAIGQRQKDTRHQNGRDENGSQHESSTRLLSPMSTEGRQAAVGLSSGVHFLPWQRAGLPRVRGR